MKSTSRRKNRSTRARITLLQQREAVAIQVEIAREVYWAGQLAEVEQALRRALRIELGHPDASMMLSQLLHRAGRSRDAYSLMLESVRANPLEALLHFELGRAALLADHLPEAERALLKFLDLVQRRPALLRDRRREFLRAAKEMLADVRRLAKGAGAKSTPAKGKTGAGAIGTARPRTSPPEPAQRSLFAVRATLRGPAARPAAPPAEEEQRPPAVPSTGKPALLVRFDDGGAGPSSMTAPSWIDDPWSDELEDRELLLEAQRIGLLSHYDDLLCLEAVRGVQRLEFQVETARRILRRLNGRALLCDEVGLGKTIEAGMVIKEYLLRGLVRSALLLVPPGLVRQWRDEMSSKFSLEFRIWGEKGGPDGDPGGPLLAIGSIATARMERNRDAFVGMEWDLVVVDEAHHLRRRSTRAWGLVNSLRKRFLLLLSATPVHGDLMELYELVTLVRPGLLGTPAEFRRRFLADAKGRRAKDPERLREALSEVMVRNTRSHADVVLPKRFASTLVLAAPETEANAYRAASAFARLVYPKLDPLARMRLRHLLGCAASGPRAVAAAAAGWLDGGVAGDGEKVPDATKGTGAEWELVDPSATRLLEEILASARAAGGSVKAKRLLDMARASSEQMVVFCRFRATLDELSAELSSAGVEHAVYHGALTSGQKERSIELFRSGARILLSTESGGEGRNIQFCRTVINYDLPWDPMLIEQRIGRVHRIGQRRDVFVFNLVLAGTLEEELLRILDEKIHLFELIVGEVDSILGHLERREEFADILLDLWAGAADDAERRLRFESFGRELDAARASYEKERSLDASLFSDSLEV